MDGSRLDFGADDRRTLRQHRPAVGAFAGIPVGLCRGLAHTANGASFPRKAFLLQCFICPGCRCRLPAHSYYASNHLRKPLSIRRLYEPAMELGLAGFSTSAFFDEPWPSRFHSYSCACDCRIVLASGKPVPRGKDLSRSNAGLLLLHLRLSLVAWDDWARQPLFHFANAAFCGGPCGHVLSGRPYLG